MSMPVTDPSSNTATPVAQGTQQAALGVASPGAAAAPNTSTPSPTPVTSGGAEWPASATAPTPSLSTASSSQSLGSSVPADATTNGSSPVAAPAAQQPAAAPTTLVPQLAADPPKPQFTEDEAAKIIQDKFRNSLGRPKPIPVALPANAPTSAPDPTPPTESLAKPPSDLPKSETDVSPDDPSIPESKGPSWWPTNVIGRYEFYRPSLVFAAAGTGLFALGYFRKSFAWAAVVSMFTIPLYMREMKMLGALRDRYFTSAARTRLEEKGLTWPLENYLGPLHIFRRTALFLTASQVVFLVGYFQQSYAWILLIIAGTIPVWARETRLESLRIKYQTQEALRREKFLTGVEESAEWLNFFLDRYWQQFEPFLSSQIIDTLNASLRKFKPAILHSMEIVECTLGTRSPRISSFQHWSRGESNVMKLQTALSFVPPTVADMADYVAEEARHPGATSVPDPVTAEQATSTPSPFPPRPAPKPCRIVLAIRVGRGTLKIPILIELTNVIIENFEVVVTLTLNSQFPHMQSVNIATPLVGLFRHVDFSLRPLMALDLISIPGLHQAIENAIDNAINGVFGKVDPNGVRGLTIQIAKEPSLKVDTAPDHTAGVLRCRMISAINLRPKGNYRATLKLGGNVLMTTTSVSDQGTPLWNAVSDIPISHMSFANTAGFPTTDDLVLEVTDQDFSMINAKPLRTKALHIGRWLTAAKDIPQELSTEKALLTLPEGSDRRKILEAWGLPIKPDLMSKRLYDPSNSLGLRNKNLSDAQVPQIQVVLRFFDLKDLGPDAKPVWQVAEERQGLLAVTVHQGANLKDSTSFVPTFDQDPNANISGGSGGAVGAVTKTLTGAVKGAINVVSAGANSVTSLVTGTFEPFVTIVDAEWDQNTRSWKEGRLRYETKSVLAASGNPVWAEKTEMIIDDADKQYFMCKVASRMDLGGTAIPVGRCVISLKEAIATSENDYFGSWWPISSDTDGKLAGRLRIQFNFQPLKLPPKDFGHKAGVREVMGADLHLMPDFDFVGYVPGQEDGTADVPMQVNDGTVDEGPKFTEKPISATVSVAKDIAATIATTPLAVTGKVTEEVKSTFGKIENLIHTRKTKEGPAESSVMQQIQQAATTPQTPPSGVPWDPASGTPAPAAAPPPKSPEQLRRELLPAGELNIRFTDCANLHPLEDGSLVSSYIKVFGPDSHQMMKSDTVKKSLAPTFRDAQLITKLKEGEAPVYTVVVYHEYALRKDPELGVAHLDIRALYSQYVLKKSVNYDPAKSAITIFESVLDLLHPDGPLKGTSTGASARINVTFKRD